LIFCLRALCWDGALARTSYQDNVIGAVSFNRDIPGPEFLKNSGNSGLTKSPLALFWKLDVIGCLLYGSSASKRPLSSGSSLDGYREEYLIKKKRIQ
jgi:hypothetical protein